VQAGRVDATRYLALVETLAPRPTRTIWDHVTVPALLSDLIDSPGDQAVFDRYVVRLLDTPFASVGWDARRASPPTALVRRSLIEALGRAGHKRSCGGAVPFCSARAQADRSGDPARGAERRRPLRRRGDLRSPAPENA